MGLDMFLSKKIYIGANYEHRKVSGVIDIIIGENPVKINFNKVTSIEEEVGYWRKANQIHKWFVDNVQEGVDNCGDYHVRKDQLKELYNLCKRVLEEKQFAEDLLPTQGGFFFGTYEYDEWYFSKLEDTIEMLKPIIEDEEDDSSYIYSSSW